jgi:hypothetical protein
MRELPPVYFPGKPSLNLMDTGTSQSPETNIDTVDSTASIPRIMDTQKLSHICFLSHGKVDIIAADVKKSRHSVNKANNLSDRSSYRPRSGNPLDFELGLRRLNSMKSRVSHFTAFPWYDI